MKISFNDFKRNFRSKENHALIKWAFFIQIAFLNWTKGKNQFHKHVNVDFSTLFENVCLDSYAVTIDFSEPFCISLSVNLSKMSLRIVMCWVWISKNSFVSFYQSINLPKNVSVDSYAGNLYMYFSALIYMYDSL